MIYHVAYSARSQAGKLSKIQLTIARCREYCKPHRQRAWTVSITANKVFDTFYH